MERSRMKRKLLVCLCSSMVLVLAYNWQRAQAGLGLENMLPNWFHMGTDWASVGVKIMDNSNDDAAELNTHQLLTRAGFDWENHYSLADDGYVTQIIRIINPLANRRRLRPIPVILIHGQTSNSRNFVMQSNAQHRPMKWPPRNDRPPPAHKGGLEGLASLLEEKSVSNHLGSVSSNRSLALMMANRGFDVWLVSTRGSDYANRGYVREVHLRTLKKRYNKRKQNMSKGADLLLEERQKRSYWSFTLDDQIEYELPSQVATVLNVTGAHKVTLIGYSNSALTTISMLSIRPDIGRLVDSYIGIAPVLFYNKLGGWFKWFSEDLLGLFPSNLDNSLFISDKLANFVRRILIRGCTNLPARYTICKYFLDFAFGRSPRFQTNLELPFFGHLVWPTSWRSMAQHIQHIKSHKMAKFDYGRELNMRYYGQEEPPEYRIEDIDPEIKIGFVSGVEDQWANQHTLDEARQRLPRKPDLDIVLKDYNHLDLTAAFDVDQTVNQPVLKFLEERLAIFKKELAENKLELGTFDELERRNRLGDETLRKIQDKAEADAEAGHAQQEPGGLSALKLAPVKEFVNPIAPLKKLLNWRDTLVQERQESRARGLQSDMMVGPAWAPMDEGSPTAINSS